MCTNTHLIYNKYIKKMVTCDCGKCETCRQSKAMRRANRIRHNVVDGEICLFVTLTYDNRFVPYILHDDLIRQEKDLKVYRDFKVRKKRVGSRYLFIDKVERCDTPESLDGDFYFDYPEDFNPFKVKELNKKRGKIGVCYYEDLKDFIKRLRINYFRRYGIKAKFTYFACSEYGGKSQRPHFHLLLFVPASEEKAFRSLVVSCWPYADKYRTAKFVEVARDAASYVASYVNGGSALCEVLETPFFKQKHSYSKDFGVRLQSFHLLEVLRKVDTGTLTYFDDRIKSSSGSLIPLPVPSYVINRYFPKFKGYSRIAPYQVFECLLYPENLFSYKRDIDYSDDEIYRIMVSLKNAKAYYCAVTGNSDYHFCIDYERVWRCRASTILKLSFYEDGVPITDFYSHYENANELLLGRVHAPTLDLSDESLLKYECDPNRLAFRLRQDSVMRPLYYRMCKQRFVTNTIMSENLMLNV